MKEIRVTPTAIRLFLRHAQPRSFAECWEWQGPCVWDGYGQLGYQLDKRPVVMRAHRVSYTLFRGPIPKGLVLDHLCRNRACVNPLHLDAVTVAENNRRGIRLVGEDHPCAAKTHCPKGHEYTAENTIRWGTGGGRRCRTCERDRSRRRKAQERAA